MLQPNRVMFDKWYSGKYMCDPSAVQWGTRVAVSAVTGPRAGRPGNLNLTPISSRDFAKNLPALKNVYAALRPTQPVGTSGLYPRG
jgi:hypothetical protein